MKGDSASLKILELDFEVPPNTQKGSINTLEGFIQCSVEELEKDQPVRKVREGAEGWEWHLITVDHAP